MAARVAALSPATGGLPGGAPWKRGRFRSPAAVTARITHSSSIASGPKAAPPGAVFRSGAQGSLGVAMDDGLVFSPARLIRCIDAARKLRVGRRVLASLYEQGVVGGERVGPHLWLSRQDLAAYAFSRPWCIFPGCNRRVMTRTGSCCTEHRGQSLKRSCDQCGEQFNLTPSRPRPSRFCSEACRRKWVAERCRAMNDAAPGIGRCCEWCEGDFEIRPWEEELGLGRFCSRECLLGYLNRDPADQLARLQQGHAEWATARAQALRKLGLMTLEDVSAALPRELRRSPAVIWAHARAGRLTATPNEFGVLLFSDAAVDDFIVRLIEHPDGRLQRFNATSEDKVRWRAGVFMKNRHGATASAREFGRLATVIKKAGPKVKLADDEVARILDLNGRGKSQRAIALAVGVSHKQVRRVLAAQGG